MPPPPPSICGKCRRGDDQGKGKQRKRDDQYDSGSPMDRHQRYSAQRRSRSEAPKSSDRISIHVHQNTYAGGETWTSRSSPHGDNRSSKLPTTHSHRTQPVHIEEVKIMQPAQGNKEAERGVGDRQLFHGPLRVAPPPPPVPTTVPAPQALQPSQALQPGPSSKANRGNGAEVEQEYTYIQGSSAVSPRDLMAQARAREDASTSKTRMWVEMQRSISAAQSQQQTSMPPPQINKAPNDSTLGPKNDGRVAKDKATDSKSEGSIRRIAREEVVRYRQAERKVEEHPRPYGYGLEGDASVQASRSSRSLTTDDHLVTRSQSSQSRKSMPRRPPQAGYSGNNTPKASNTEKSAHASVESSQKSNAKAKPSSSKLDGQRSVSRSGPRTSQAGGRSDGRRTTMVLEERIMMQPREPLHYTSTPRDYDVEVRDERLSGNRSEIRHRRSFETEFTVHPHSSISQQPPVLYVDHNRTHTWRTQTPDNPQLPEVGSGKARKFSVYVRETGGRVPGDVGKLQPQAPHRAVVTPPKQTHAPSQPSRPASQLNSGYVSSSHQFEKAERDRERVKNRDRHGYEKAPPSRPPSPPRSQRLSEEHWTYHEAISPNKVRVVRERMIHSRLASVERPTAPTQPGKPRVTRYEILDEPRSVPEDRGRARLREGEEAPKQRLRSILRSSSSQKDGQRTRSSSFGHRVSFSEAVDVTTLSPPPSSSYMGFGERSERAEGFMDRFSRPKHKRNLSDDSRERYHYQRTRRPDWEELEQAAQIPDPEPISRRRALARALSESPSRERGLDMIEEARASHYRQPRYPTKKQVEPEVVRPRKEESPRSRRMSDRGSDRAGTRRSPSPFRAPPSALASDNTRVPVMMSGGLSGWPTRRDAPPASDEWARDPTPPPPVISRDSMRPVTATRTSERGDRGPLSPCYDDNRTGRRQSDFYQDASSTPSRRTSRTETETRPVSERIVREGRDEKGRWYEVERVVRDDGRSGKRSSGFSDVKSRYSRSDNGWYDDRREAAARYSSSGKESDRRREGGRDYRDR
ncbi:hypothetical protein K461DRAFT_295417 [Myriangium duriaei CBS 260.36]|uniref:Uncharacterized protein n=1 Tax=Myriangium duriaei CBS 260.36 TaxID=1168546 RepID=A0A9P4IYM7_9PEZI|nr:hypothetical protein K461DRAFT_295417 [Myriangium duriaei CBS 260.36]